MTPERRALLELIKNGCPEGRAFALRFDSIRDVWDACDRADWLCWMATRAPNPIPDAVVLAFVRYWLERADRLYFIAGTSQSDVAHVMAAMGLLNQFCSGSISFRLMLDKLDQLPPEFKEAVARAYDPALWRAMARNLRWGHPFERCWPDSVPSIPEPRARLMHSGPVS